MKEKLKEKLIDGAIFAGLATMVLGLGTLYSLRPKEPFPAQMSYASKRVSHNAGHKNFLEDYPLPRINEEYFSELKR